MSSTVPTELADLLPPGIMGVFALMEIAEDEISKVPGAFEAFSVCGPHHSKIGDTLKGERVYRAHCAELCRRVARGQDTRPATDAEVVAFVSDLSLEARPRPEYAAIYARLFAKLWPDVASRLELEALTSGGDAQYRAEVETDIRRRLTMPDRVVRVRA